MSRRPSVRSSSSSEPRASPARRRSSSSTRPTWCKRSHRPASAAALRELRRAVPDHPADGQGLGQHGALSHPRSLITSHDPGRWDLRPAVDSGLNSGDATGAAYWSTTLPLQRPTPLPPTAHSAARGVLERQYATIEITDSVAMMGGHQVALACAAITDACSRPCRRSKATCSTACSATTR